MKRCCRGEVKLQAWRGGVWIVAPEVTDREMWSSEGERLPEPRAGVPTRRLPPAARPGGAWVPMIAPEDASGPDADVYGDGGFMPNIMRALSLVPDEVRMLRRLSATHYLPVEQIPDPMARRALDRMQIELVAARVSAVNECFY